MTLHPPSWWQNETGRILPKYLAPLGNLYGAIVKARFRYTKQYECRLPVVCIGNFTQGGTGKTPISIKLASMMQQEGWQPTFLSRGYKGKTAGPILVDSEIHNAEDVGDEPLLLTRQAPTIVAKNRVDGIWLIEQRNSNFVILDDGFQNPTVRKNISIIAIDSATGLGNHRIFPAGPLRAPLDFQLARADAIIVTGGNSEGIITELKTKYEFKNPILSGSLRPVEDTGWVKDKPILAYAGIARPEKLFSSLQNAGGKVIRRIPFPDHHQFTAKDANLLTKLALADDLQLITTEKDLVRITDKQSHQLRALKRMSRAFPVEFVFDEDGEATLLQLIQSHFPRPPKPE